MKTPDKQQTASVVDKRKPYVKDRLQAIFLPYDVFTCKP